MITYAQARTPLSGEQIRAEVAAQLAARGVDINSFSELSVPRAELELNAAALAYEQGIRAVLAGCISLVGAAAAGDDWLDVVAVARYQESRIPAIATGWNLTLTAAPAAGTIVFRPRELRAIATTGALFANVNDVEVAIAPGASTTVPFEAVEAGIGGNVPVGAISDFKVGKPGLSCLNGVGSLVRAGRAKETNAAYIARCYAKWGSLGAGNLAWYNYWIPKSAPTVTRWRVRDDNPGGPATVWLYLANAAGPATPTEIVQAEAEILPRKPNGLQVSIFPAPAVPVTVVATLTGDGSNPSLLADATSALLTLASNYDLGPGEIAPSLLVSVLQGGEFDTLGLEGFGGVASVGYTGPSSVVLTAGGVLQITPNLTVV